MYRFKLIAVAISIFCFTSQGKAQELEDQIDELKGQIQLLGNLLQKERSNENCNALKEKIEAFSTVNATLQLKIKGLKQENDSLLALVDSLQQHILLNMSGQESIALRVEKNITDINESDLGKGCYLVVCSTKYGDLLKREEEKIVEILPDMTFLRYKNTKNDWWHLVISEKYARETIGKEVYKLRAKGIRGAWWIAVEKENPTTTVKKEQISESALKVAKEENNVVVKETTDVVVEEQANTVMEDTTSVEVIEKPAEEVSGKEEGSSLNEVVTTNNVVENVISDSLANDSLINSIEQELKRLNEALKQKEAQKLKKENGN